MKYALIFSLTCFFLSVTTMNSWAVELESINRWKEQTLEWCHYKKNGEGTCKIGNKATCKVEFYVHQTSPTSNVTTFIEKNFKQLIYITVMQVDEGLKEGELKVSDLLFGERERDSLQQNGDGTEENPVVNRRYQHDLEKAIKEGNEEKTLTLFRAKFDESLTYCEKPCRIKEGDEVLIRFKQGKDYDKINHKATANEVFVETAYFGTPAFLHEKYSSANVLKKLILEHFIGSKANDNELKVELLGNHDSKKESFDNKKLEEEGPAYNNPIVVSKFKRIKRSLRKKPAKFLCCFKTKESN